MFRLDRARSAGTLLEWKVAIFLVAAVMGLSGMYLEEDWLTGAATVLLLGGVLLRVTGRAESPGDSDEDDAGPAP